MSRLQSPSGSTSELSPWLEKVERWLLAKREFRMVPDLRVPFAPEDPAPPGPGGRRVAFAGFPSDFSLLILLGLLRSDVTVAGLVTSLGAHPSIAGENALSQVADHIGVPLLRLARVNDYDSVAALRRLGADMFLVASFDQILHRRALEVPCLGWVNVHPSLLPKYRGPEPVYWALVHGEEEAGASFQRVGAGIDSGPLLRQVPVKVEERDSTGSLTRRITEAAWAVVPEVIGRALAGDPGQPMDLDQGSYFTSVGHRRIDRAESAQMADRLVRAGNPNMLAATLHQGRVCYVRQARPVAPADPAPGPRLHFPDGDLLLEETVDRCGCHHAEPVGSCPHDKWS